MSVFDFYPISSRLNDAVFALFAQDMRNDPDEAINNHLVDMAAETYFESICESEISCFTR
jgi:hypothetical protein